MDKKEVKELTDEPPGSYNSNYSIWRGVCDLVYCLSSYPRYYQAASILAIHYDFHRRDAYVDYRNLVSKAWNFLVSRQLCSGWSIGKFNSNEM